MRDWESLGAQKLWWMFWSVEETSQVWNEVVCEPVCVQTILAIWIFLVELRTAKEQSFVVSDQHNIDIFHNDFTSKNVIVAWRVQPEILLVL